MTKKKEPEYTELDIILQANSITMREVSELAQELIEKYEGNMAPDVAANAAKNYYMFGKLAMKLDPDLRKKAESEVKKYFKERSARLEKKNKPVKGK